MKDLYNAYQILVREPMGVHSKKYPREAYLFMENIIRHELMTKRGFTLVETYNESTKILNIVARKKITSVKGIGINLQLNYEIPRVNKSRKMEPINVNAVGTSITIDSEHGSDTIIHWQPTAWALSSIWTLKRAQEASISKREASLYKALNKKTQSYVTLWMKQILIGDFMGVFKEHIIRANERRMERTNRRVKTIGVILTQDSK